jgi:aspartyl/asparaginyl-tRNA synthetase
MYLGKTTRNPYNYPGSGLYWKRHLKVHGNDISTDIIFETDCPEEFKEFSSKYSEENNIVESKDWANMRPETGHGGFSREDAYKGFIKRCSKGGKASVASGYGYTSETGRKSGKKGGEGNKGKPKSEAHKQAIRDSWKRKKGLL